MGRVRRGRSALVVAAKASIAAWVVVSNLTMIGNQAMLLTPLGVCVPSIHMAVCITHLVRMRTAPKKPHQMLADRVEEISSSVPSRKHFGPSGVRFCSAARQGLSSKFCLEKLGMQAVVTITSRKKG